VVIGGGLTGLSTAYYTARKGARTVLVEKDKVGSGASGRNGSMCTQGITIGVGEARKRYGQQRARELYDSFREAVDIVEELTQKEQIDCDFHRSGRLGVAFKPQHFESMRATQRDLADNFGHETVVLSKSELRSELGTDYYHGALLDPDSAGLHSSLVDALDASRQADLAFQSWANSLSRSCTRTAARNSPLRAEGMRESATARSHKEDFVASWNAVCDANGWAHLKETDI